MAVQGHSGVRLEVTDSRDLARGGLAWKGDLRTLVEATRTRRDLKLWPKQNRRVALAKAKPAGGGSKPNRGLIRFRVMVFFHFGSSYWY